MDEEGYIKFKLHWEQTPALAHAVIANLLAIRNKLHTLGLIGVTTEGIGFGNVSARLDQTEHFIITGTQTGHRRDLTADGVTAVTDYSFSDHSLHCRGPVKASSESLSHAALYSASLEINAVIHVHSLTLWESLLSVYPATSVTIPYGTPEMAREIKRLLTLKPIQHSKIFAMAGHHGGVIIFGSSLEQTLENLLQHTVTK